jgi:hypothetical protein
MMRKLDVFPAAIGLDPRIFLRFVFALTILLCAPVAFADDLSTLEEGFVCENIKVQVSTTCASDPEAPFDQRCAEQHFIFADANGKILAKVPASGQLREKVGLHGKKMGEWLDGLASGGACLKGRDGSFVVIKYFTTQLFDPIPAWDEIYDLKGHMLASSRVVEPVVNEEKERIEKEYHQTYRALGLPWGEPIDFQGFRKYKDPLRLPKPASSEDWSHIHLHKPVGYEHRYMNSDNDAVRDTLDIEKVSDRRINFIIDTMDDSGRACRLAREASATKDNPLDFVFPHGKKCRLHLKVAADGKSIRVTDPGGYCSSQHCNGCLGDFTFQRVK